MPKFEAKTVAAEQVWKSPDGNRTIYEVTLDTGKGNAKAKTFSDAIAKVGWSGEVETWEKEGKQGAETFVKQPQKEGGFRGGGGKRETDPFTMYLSYAKDLMVARVVAGLEKADFQTQVQTVLGAGHELYNGRPSAQPTETETKEPTVTPIEGEEVSVNDLNDLFPE